MGKRLSKTRLLAEIADERARLLELLETIPRRQMTKRGMNSLNWSIKDIVAHLFDWEQRTSCWYESGIAEESPEVPGDGFKWSENRQLNDFIYRTHRRKSLADVMAEFECVHRRTLANLKQATDNS